MLAPSSLCERVERVSTRIFSLWTGAVVLSYLEHLRGGVQYLHSNPHLVFLGSWASKVCWVKAHLRIQRKEAKIWGDLEVWEGKLLLGRIYSLKIGILLLIKKIKLGSMKTSVKKGECSVSGQSQGQAQAYSQRILLILQGEQEGAPTFSKWNHQCLSHQ